MAIATLSDVRPNLAQLDGADRRLTDIESTSHGDLPLAIGNAASDFPNIMFGQYCAPDALATRATFRSTAGARLLASLDRLRMSAGSVAVASRNALRMKFGSVRIASRLASLHDHVGDVSIVGSEPKVIGPNTSPVVAGMAHEEAVRNVSTRHKPRDAMSLHRRRGSNPKMTIASRPDRKPFPAIFALVNLSPKAGFVFLGKLQVGGG